MEPAVMGREQKKLEGGLFKFVTPAPKMKGNDSPDRGNTNHNHATLKKTQKDKRKAQPDCMNCFC